MNVTGMWKIVSSPDFDDDYLRMEVEPYVELIQSGNRVSGSYHVGLQQGEIDGRIEGEGESASPSRWQPVLGQPLEPVREHADGRADPDSHGLCRAESSRRAILVKLTPLALYVGNHGTVSFVVGKGAGMMWPCRLKCGAAVLNRYLDDLSASPTTRREGLAYLGKRGFA